MPRRPRYGPPKKRPKVKSRLKRRVFLARMDTLSLLLRITTQDMQKAYRVNYDGLSEVEQKFMQSRLVTLDQTMQDISRLHRKIFDDVKWW